MNHADTHAWTMGALANIGVPVIDEPLTAAVVGPCVLIDRETLTGAELSMGCEAWLMRITAHVVSGGESRPRSQLRELTDAVLLALTDAGGYDPTTTPSTVTTGATNPLESITVQVTAP